MDRQALLKFVSHGPKSRKEIMENGIPLNTTFRVTVGELEREGLVRFSPENNTVTITPEGRREMRGGQAYVS
jgi:DNA-binding IclR family transcriptional regulator